MINAFVSLLAAAVLFAGGFTYDVPDIMMPDTDRDGSADAVDAEPLNPNPMINYIVVGLDYEDTDTFSDEISYYESLMDSAGMEWIEVHISTWDEFTEFWQHMKNYRPDGTYGELEYYSGVDNLIIECHGNESGLLFDPYDGYQGINIIDYGLLGSLQSAHINVLNLWSCFSAYTRGETSAAREAVLNLDVDEAYGWSGLVYYDPVVNMSYYAYPEADGYFRFTRDGSAEADAERIRHTVSWYDPAANLVLYYFDTVLYSTESAAAR